ncbi:PrsW family glutamic-type intramembrane protease [Ornithinibacillus scapharcae]|uniref:PrsW family glutamic-type intramembrane protease n=1 Tax=Ornithinibacillus scapharcae TaxID=1147159 RepID=UPI000225B583|nr:PrsW family glutamic-type intramembrane protease [Ornithinibacillus scapharcae]
MFCSECGTQLVHGSNFCSSCGAKVRIQAEESNQQEPVSERKQSPKSIQDSVKDTFLNATGKVNAMLGEQGNIDLNLRDLFSTVFRKHSKDEGEAIFISGTKTTTPEEKDISTSWPKPWLFSRVFLLLAITYILLYISTFSFQNSNALPGLIIIGAFAVPFSLLIFFWESNAPRNISFYEIAKMLFVGGAASLVVTLLLFSFLPVGELDYMGAIIVGVVEEVGKLIIIVYFIKQLNPKFILNGLLIGAAIGAGFAAFESAGYALRFGMMFGDGTMLQVIFQRAWTGIGTHVVWAAISGAALVYVKESNPLKADHLRDMKFLKLFAVPVILHSIWDMPLYFLQKFNFLYILLIVIAWIFIFTMMNAGLKQIARLNTQVREEMTSVS